MSSPELQPLFVKNVLIYNKVIPAKITTLDNYIEQHTTPEDAILEELRRETHLNVMHPRMLSGPVQGQFLKMVCQMIRPRNVLEIGTFTGYSAICMARGMPREGHLFTIEKEDELEPVIRTFIRKAGLENKITLLLGDALELIKEMQTTFDLVFIDGDKREYPQYYKAVLPLLQPGGYLMADNVLWNGKVTEPLEPDDEFTRGILELNRMVRNDCTTEQVILPLRDGLMLVRKKEEAK